MRTKRRSAVPFLAALRAPALRWPWRVVAAYLSVTQFIIAQPVLIGAFVLSVAGPEPRAVANPSEAAVGIVPSADLIQSSDASILLAQNTVSNRDVPTDLPVKSPTFSDSPSEDEIFTNGGLQEPMVPIGEAKPSTTENKALTAALAAYRTTRIKNPEDVTALTGFLSSYPNSQWRAALLTNLGLIYRQTGYFSRALDAWEEAYKLASASKQEKATSVANRALSELAELNSRLGRQERLKTLLAQAEQRQTKGSVANRIDGARTGLSMMQHQPGTSFKCGPYALERILASQKTLDGEKAEIVHKAQSTEQGTSLTQVTQLSRTLGMNYQMAKRQPGSAVIVPSVVNWKAGHFAALVKQLGNGKYWIEDPTFGKGIQVSQAALDEEGSGYVLVPQQPLPKGWQSVDEQEGATVWGKGTVTGRDDPGCGDSETGGGGPSCTGCAEGPGFGAPNIAMPGYRVFTTAVSLHITDTPVGYVAPVGSSVFNTLAYDQYEANQLAGFKYSNFGPLWNYSWLSYIAFDASQNPSVHEAGGGTTAYSAANFDSSTNSYGVNSRGQTSLEKVSATNYIEHFADGSAAVYSVPDASGNLFLKQRIDTKGNAVTLHYAIEADPMASYPLQISSITDAMGQPTTFSYDLPDNAPSHTNKYLVTKITDPFLRSASFGYTVIGGSYQLTSITDVIGMTSYFGYQGSNISWMNTPYGTTTFTYSTLDNGTTRVLEAADPYGAKERWEGWINASPTNDYEQVVPSGMNLTNTYLEYRNTFYWDKKAMVDDPSHSYANATIYHWLHTPGDLASHTMESLKRPLENRVWFNYPGQYSSIVEGTSDRPTAIGRVLDDGTTQLYQFQYSADNTHLVQEIDAKGRISLFDYDTNGVDILMARQATSSSASIVLQKRVYNTSYPPHCPQQIITSSGQATSYEYDAQGHVTKVTNPKGEITTYSYTRPNSNAGPQDGYLYSKTGPVSNSTTSYTYDPFGRIQTVTDSEGYTITLEYDALDRIVKTHYPDQSYNQIIYNRLDIEWMRDRSGQWKHLFHDALRHLVAEQDALGRVTNFGYCLCGALTSLTDPAGNTTNWTQDIQGRQTSKTYPDGKQVLYTYGNYTSRLASVTDAKGQVVNYLYDTDEKLKQISYTSTHSTPTVNFGYDSIYDRLATIADDSTGTATYGYGQYIPYGASSFALALYNAWPGNAATTGAGLLTSETKVGNSGMASYVISYGYDILDRQNVRDVDGTNNHSYINYDSLGRIVSATNQLGSFGYTYTTPTSYRVAMVYLGSPSGLRTSYAYDSEPNSDPRITTISNLSPSGTTISEFDYMHDAVGNVTTWTQQADNQAAQQYNLGYDPAHQLTSVLVTDATPNHALLKTYSFGYDAAANLTSEQNDYVVNQTAPNQLNQIASASAGGLMRFAGTLNEPATVTVGGKPAQVANLTFSAYVNVTGGSNTIAVTATNPAGLTTTQNYQVQVNSTAVTGNPSYDFNGNMTNDGGGRTFEWDAANRLTAVNYTTTGNRSEFVYDGLSRRVQITEKVGNTTSTSNYVWDVRASEPCEMRTGASTVVKRYYPQGQQIGISNYFETHDHLGSSRELTDNVGNVVARYAYDPYGNRTKISGNVDSDFGFSGHYFHQPSNLHLALYRAYDSTSAKWLSRDPMGKSAISIQAERILGPLRSSDRRMALSTLHRIPTKEPELLPEGANIYAYAANNPASMYDPLGFQAAGVLVGGAAAAGECAGAGLFNPISDALAGLILAGTLGYCVCKMPNLDEETCYLGNELMGFCVYNCRVGGVKVIPAGPNGCADTVNFPLPGPPIRGPKF